MIPPSPGALLGWCVCAHPDLVPVTVLVLHANFVTVVQHWMVNSCLPCFAHLH